jgi:hypothetical protein
MASPWTAPNNVLGADARVGARPPDGVFCTSRWVPGHYGRRSSEDPCPARLGQRHPAPGPTSDGDASRTSAVRAVPRADGARENVPTLAASEPARRSGDRPRRRGRDGPCDGIRMCLVLYGPSPARHRRGRDGLPHVDVHGPGLSTKGRRIPLGPGGHTNGPRPRLSADGPPCRPDGPRAVPHVRLRTDLGDAALARAEIAAGASPLGRGGPGRPSARGSPFYQRAPGRPKERPPTPQPRSGEDPVISRQQCLYGLAIMP